MITDRIVYVLFLSHKKIQVSKHISEIVKFYRSIWVMLKKRSKLLVKSLTNCNGNCRGQPTGQNWLIFTLLLHHPKLVLRRGILKTHHSITVLNSNRFYSDNSSIFLKVRGWNERAQQELSNKPIKGDFKNEVHLFCARIYARLTLRIMFGTQYPIYIAGELSFQDCVTVDQTTVTICRLIYQN